MPLQKSRTAHAERTGKRDASVLAKGKLSLLEIDDDEASDDEAPDDEIHIIITQIKRLAREASLEFALRVGAIIIHHFYGGESDVWRSRGPKTASFRKLARHPELPLSAGALYRCVALYELCDRLNAASRWEQLGASHLRLVLGLPQRLQEQLLTKANAERWTVRTLHEEVLRQKAVRTRGGRRPRPPIARSLMFMRKCLDDYRQTIERVGELSDEDHEFSVQLLEETRSYLEAISESLRLARLQR
jgi:hypothetical protein